MNSKQIVFLLVGAPGSGKSTFGKTLVDGDPRIVRVCPDEFRAKFGWGEGDQSVSALAFDATRRSMRDALAAGKSVIVDATNMYRKSRKDFIAIARENNAMVHAMVFEVDRVTLVERNVKRGAEGGRNVPENIIDNMLAKYQRPDEMEVDKVTFVTKLT